MYVAVVYETVEGFLERRAPFRGEHLALVRKWHEEGRLLLAGSFEPADGALLIFRVDDPAEVQEFVRSDPYVRQGLVLNYRVRKWNVVVGGSEPVS